MAPNTSPTEISREIKQLIKEIPETRADAKRLDDIRRIYTKLTQSGELQFGTPTPENKVAAKWRAFLTKHHKVVIQQLCDRVVLGRHSSVRCLWGMIAASPLTSKNGKFEYANSELLQKWLQAMVLQESEEMDRPVRRMVESEFLGAFRDVQYYSLGCIATIAHDTYKGRGQASSSRVAEKLLELLMIVPVPQSNDDMKSCQFLFPPKEGADFVGDDDHEDSDSSGDGDDDDSQVDEEDDEATRPAKKRRTAQKIKKFPFQRLNTFMMEYQNAWLAILKLDLTLSSLKRCLSFLHHYVLDFVPEPLRFADFFIQAYSDHGSGIVGVLALDGIFSLITEQGLEYKDFYKQLYRLLSSRVLYVRYRSRFYSLLTKCLVRNEMLPAHLVAAFCKRLCRTALCGPPSGALFVLALVSNLLRKHPECMCLVDRNEGDEIEDLFLPDENDPTKSRALQSSLWELAVLERHYFPSVSTLAKSIGTKAEAKTAPHSIDDFTEHTYKGLFDQAKKGRSKKTPITFQAPEKLFASTDLFAEVLAIDQ